MVLPVKVRLIRCDTNELVIAEVESLSRSTANEDIDLTWWANLANYGLNGDPNNEPDRNWDWRAICSRTYNRPGHEVRCIRTNDKLVQAATSFVIGYKSELDLGEMSIYVDRLATAPWNRGWLVGSPQYRRGGCQLIRYIVNYSYMLGLKGRVNLTVVANLDFYLKLGFQETLKANGDGKIYELSTDAARRFMEDRGSP
jgi:hypothetical protein